MTAEQPDVVRMLLDQHELVRQTFARVLDETGTARRQLFDELADLLRIHESGEQRVIHPVTRTAERAAETVADRLREEAEATRAVDELRELGTDAPGFPGRLEELRRSVLEHAAREEREEFPLLGELPEAKVASLADELRQAQAGD